MRVCQCGITFRRYPDCSDFEIYFCPRCVAFEIMVDGRVERVEGAKAQAAYDELDKALKRLQMMEDLLVEYRLRRAPSILGERTAACVNCGHAVEAKCGAVCENCKTVQPCSTEG